MSKKDLTTGQSIQDSLVLLRMIEGRLWKRIQLVIIPDSEPPVLAASPPALAEAFSNPAGGGVSLSAPVECLGDTGEADDEDVEVVDMLTERPFKGHWRSLTIKRDCYFSS